MNQVWIDLNSPTKEEIDSLTLTQNVSPLIARDFLVPTPTQHAKIDDDVIYAVLQIPFFHHSRLESGTQEIDFLISKSGLITGRYDSIDALHYFDKRAEVNEILDRGEDSHLFFEIMRSIYESMENELAYTEDWMKEIEKNIFAGREKDMVFAISNLGRNLLNFKRTADSHGNVFEIIKEAGTEKFGKEFGSQIKELLDKWRSLMRAVNSRLDLIAELRETNNAMLSTKQNEIMKIFTIMAFVTFPLSLIASIFGMNTSFIPLVGTNNDFWIVMGIMLAMSFAMFVYFRHKKWI